MLNHIDQIWPSLLQLAMASPQVDGTQGRLDGEIIGASILLDGSQEQFCLNPRRRLSPIYASAELLWYLRMEYDIAMIKAYAPQYEKFADPHGRAFGAYGGRLAGNLEHVTDGVSDENLLEEAIVLLQRKPSTKKCVISLWRPDDILYSGHRDYYTHCKDIPCTISWQFLRRGEELHMICNMRSNDLWLGFLYDVYVNTVIQRYVAAKLGCRAGIYRHNAGSLHLYERNVKAAGEACSIGILDSVVYHTPSALECGWSQDDLKLALEAEEAVRLHKAVYCSSEVGSVLNDALLCCQAQWDRSDLNFRSPVLRQAMTQYLKEKV